MLHIWTISFIMVRSHLHTLFSDFASILLKILASTSTRFDNAESMSPHQQDIYQMLVEDLGHPERSEEPPNNWVGCGGVAIWEERWRQEGVAGTPEGRLGAGSGLHTWRDTFTFWDQQGLGGTWGIGDRGNTSSILHPWLLSSRELAEALGL